MTTSRQEDPSPSTVLPMQEHEVVTQEERSERDARQPYEEARRAALEPESSQVRRGSEGTGAEWNSGASSASKRPRIRRPQQRPRPVISCLECRRKKLKCDRLLPCQQCMKIGQGGRCRFASGQDPELRQAVGDRSSVDTPTRSVSPARGVERDYSDLKKGSRKSADLQQHSFDISHTPSLLGYGTGTRLASSTRLDDQTTAGQLPLRKVADVQSHLQSDDNFESGHGTGITIGHAADRRDENGSLTQVIRDLQGRVATLERILHVKQNNSCENPEFGSTEYNRPKPSESEAANTSGDYRMKPVDTSKRSLLSHFNAVVCFVQYLREDRESEDVQSLARDIRDVDKALRVRHSLHKTSYTNQEHVLAHMSRLIPRQEVCTKLVHVYLENFENCARILHKQTFLRQYQLYIQSLLDSERLSSLFIPLLLAVISIAASLHIVPECNLPGLHGEEDGVGAFQLLENWLQLSLASSQPTLETLQIFALSLRPQQSRKCTLSELWQKNGQLMRLALKMGLHQDTTQNHHPLAHSSIAITYPTPFQAEIRRRLWLTILEQDLVLSICCGMPTTCPSLTMAALPLNIDDKDFSPESLFLPSSRPSTQWTDGICQHVLAQSFNDRLAAYQLVGSGSEFSYSSVITHTKRLEETIHRLPKVFKFGYMTDEAANTPHRLLAQMELDFHLRRPLIACYRPFAQTVTQEGDRFKEARVPWIQSSLVSICFQDLFDPKFPIMDDILPRPEGLWDFFYNTYRWDIEQILFATCVELQRLRTCSQSDVELLSQDPTIGLPFHAQNPSQTARQVANPAGTNAIGGPTTTSDTSTEADVTNRGLGMETTARTATSQSRNTFSSVNTGINTSTGLNRSGNESEMMDERRTEMERDGETAENHGVTAKPKILGWTLEGMVKSLEDTIDPLTRRIGRVGADSGILRELVPWVCISGALRVGSNCRAHDAVKCELEGFVSALKQKLRLDGFTIDSRDNRSRSRRTDRNVVLDVGFDINDGKEKDKEQEVDWLVEYLSHPPGVT